MCWFYEVIFFNRRLWFPIDTDWPMVNSGTYNRFWLFWFSLEYKRVVVRSPYGPPRPCNWKVCKIGDTTRDPYVCATHSTSIYSIASFGWWRPLYSMINSSLSRSKLQLKREIILTHLWIRLKTHQNVLKIIMLKGKKRKIMWPLANTFTKNLDQYWALWVAEGRGLSSCKLSFPRPSAVTSVFGLYSA